MGTFPATGVIEQAPSRTRPSVSASTVLQSARANPVLRMFLG